MNTILDFDPKDLKPLRKMLNPHFLFNALSVIEYLSTRDPEKAKQTISEFATYLKGNFKTFDLSQKVSFDDEFYQIQCLLNIELFRFEDSLNVNYDIKVTDFEIPVLSIIKFVECIIDNGLISRIGMGNITISSYDDSLANYVKIYVCCDEYDDPTPYPPEEEEIYKFIISRIESCNGKVEIEHDLRSITILSTFNK